MIIDSLTAVAMELEFAEPLRFSHVTRKLSHNVIVCIRTSEGLDGYGEACPIPLFTRETAGSIAAVLNRDVAEHLKGKDPMQIALRTSELRRALPDFPFAVGAVDIALYDLVGKQLGVPVHQLLGGRFRREVPLHSCLGMDSTERMVEQANQLIAEGYPALKVYVGRDDLAHDLSRLVAIRKAVGEEVILFVDANGQWDLATAQRFLVAARDLDIRLIEQPLSPADTAGLHTLAGESSGIDIGLDESVRDLPGMGPYLSSGSSFVFNVGVSKFGGVANSYLAGTAAAALGRRVIIGSLLETEIGTLAALHVAAALPSLPFPSYLVGPLKYRRRLGPGSFHVERGMVRVPDGPGLSFELDGKFRAAFPP